MQPIDIADLHLQRRGVLLVRIGPFYVIFASELATVDGGLKSRSFDQLWVAQ